MTNKQFYNKIKKILDGQDKSPMITLEQIKKELEVEIVTNGKIDKNLLQAFKRIQKEMENRDRFQKVLVNENGLYTITNSFYLVTYNENQLPCELIPFIDNTNDHTYADFNFNHWQDDKKRNLLSLNMDALKKVYNYNKLHKEENIFILDNGFTFNLQYFFDILALMEVKGLVEVTLQISDDIHAPMYILGKNANALLLPLRVTQEQIEARKSIQKKILEEG